MAATTKNVISGAGAVQPAASTNRSMITASNAGGGESDWCVAFWHAPHWGAQWLKCEFVVDGITFNCAEQFMMYQKAKLFNDRRTAEHILTLTEPKLMKASGRKVTPFDENKWNEHSMRIVTEGNLAKFSQNPSLKAALLATAEKVIVEASPLDTIWGIGVGVEKAVASRENWRGQNKLGQCLMAVRTQLRNEDKNKEKEPKTAEKKDE